VWSRSRQFGSVRRDTSALVPNCPDTSAPVRWCRNVLGPKCPGSEVSWHQNNNWHCQPVCPCCRLTVIKRCSTSFFCKIICTCGHYATLAGPRVNSDDDAGRLSTFVGQQTMLSFTITECMLACFPPHCWGLEITLCTNNHHCCLSLANREHSATVLFDQSLISSVHLHLSLPRLLLSMSFPSNISICLHPYGIHDWLIQLGITYIIKQKN